MEHDTNKMESHMRQSIATHSRMQTLLEQAEKAGTRSKEDKRRIALLSEEHGFPHGLGDSLMEHADLFAQRIWILDNSGSMQIGDGSRLVEITESSNGSSKRNKSNHPGPHMETQAVARWEELQTVVLHHAALAGCLQMPTHFRLLNFPGERIGVQEFSIAADISPTTVSQEIKDAQYILQNVKPAGVTPLTDHIRSIEQTVRLFQPELRASDKKVAIVIATDGLPTNAAGDESPAVQEEFVQALKLMEDLPVWVVVRLCTNDEKVADFYNALDSLLELSLEVLDDQAGEAMEVARYNKWLNYALPLHRCREVGCQHRLLDLLDERSLTITEIKEFCKILWGREIVDPWPDPAVEWQDFCHALTKQMEEDQKQQNGREHWDPVRHKPAPWINIKALTQMYGPPTGIRRLGCVLGQKPKNQGI